MYAIRSYYEPEAGANAARDDAPDLSIPLAEQVDDLRVRLAREALRLSRHNQRAAAGLLGMTYDQFRALLRRHKGRITGT